MQLGEKEEIDKESRQKKFAQELQEQIKQRDEARVKEQIRQRGKLPSYLHDENEELPQPAYKKSFSSNHQSAPAPPQAAPETMSMGGAGNSESVHNLPAN